MRLSLVLFLWPALFLSAGPIGVPSAHVTSADLFQRGLAAAAKGDLATAQKYFEASQEQPGSCVGLGEIALRRGQQERAEQYFRKALTVAPADGQAHFRAGMALEGMGRTDSALAEFELAVRLAKTNPLPEQEIGRVYLARKEYGRAVAAFQSALGVQPHYLAARIGLGDAYLAQGDRARAEASYRAAIRIDPRYPAAHLKLAECEMVGGKMDAARGEYLAALAIDGKQPEALNNLAWMAASQGRDLDRALAWAQRAVQLDPNNPAYQSTLAWVYRGRGDYSKAVALYNATLPKAGRNSEIWYLAGVVYQESKDPRRARASFEKALALQSAFPDASDARRRLSALPAGKPYHW